MPDIIKLSKKIPLIVLDTDQIPDKPGKYCMSYGFDNSKLKRSISQIGVINHPYICRNSEDVVEVITGFRRLLAIKELDIKEVECFDLTGSKMTSYDMLNLSVNENLFTRKFNPVEKSMILNSLTKLVKEDNLINEFNSLLDVNKNEFDLILRIESLNNFIKDPVAFETLNIKALEQLLQLEEDNQIILINWINNLKLNYNYQLQFIDYINDISRIEKIPINHLLNEEEYLMLYRNKKKNIPQKAKELIDRLRIRRNPDYTKYQRLFEKKVKRLKLPKNTKIKHHRYFEAEFHQLAVEFKDGYELKKTLKELIERKELTDLVEPWLDE